MSEVTYRTFRNDDPPRILRLWNDCDLGRGAVQPQSTELFEVINYAQPYFDSCGLILAESGGEVVGCIHAGFGFQRDRSALDHNVGVICAVLVRPDHRRRGIGRRLVQRAETYLREHSAVSIQAGESRDRDPFYYGLYGGSRPSGFLDSDPLAAPFFKGVGYQVEETIGVYQRDLKVKRDPVNMRLMNIRRSTELIVAETPQKPTYWWYSHLGRMESLRFRLVDKKSQKPLAAVTVIGLDQYISAWNERAIGLVDIYVSEDHRGHGYCQTLLIETVRRVRQDMISRADLHVPDSLAELTRAVKAAGFSRFETGTVYSREG